MTENKETGKRAILVVSFGTSYNESREATIGAIEKAIAEAFPETETRRAFTSQIIIDKLKERDGLEIDNVKEALDRAAADGITELVVQPTHLMDGFEYMDLAEELEEYEGSFEQVVLADPLLTSDADFDAVAKAITEAMAEYDDGKRRSAIWDTEPRPIPTRYIPGSRKPLRRQDIRITSSAQWRQSRLWRM